MADWDIVQEISQSLEEARLHGERERSEEQHRADQLAEDTVWQLAEELLQARLHEVDTLEAGHTPEIARAAMIHILDKAENFVFSAFTRDEQRMRFRLLLYIQAFMGTAAMAKDSETERITLQEYIRAFPKWLKSATPGKRVRDMR